MKKTGHEAEAPAREPALADRLTRLEQRFDSLHSQFQRLTGSGLYYGDTIIRRETEPPKDGQEIAWMRWHARQERLKREGRNPDGTYANGSHPADRLPVMAQVEHADDDELDDMSQLDRIEALLKEQRPCLACGGSGGTDCGSLGRMDCLTCHGTGKRVRRLPLDKETSVEFEASNLGVTAEALLELRGLDDQELAARGFRRHGEYIVSANEIEQEASSDVASAGDVADQVGEEELTGVRAVPEDEGDE